MTQKRCAAYGVCAACLVRFPSHERWADRVMCRIQSQKLSIVALGRETLITALLTKHLEPESRESALLANPNALFVVSTRFRFLGGCPLGFRSLMLRSLIHRFLLCSFDCFSALSLHCKKRQHPKKNCAAKRDSGSGLIKELGNESRTLSPKKKALYETRNDRQLPAIRRMPNRHP